MKIEQEMLTPAAGLTREIGLYVAQMREVRGQVVKLAGDLTQAELAARPIAGENCIGGLLLHLLENEFWWIQSLVGGVEMTDELKARVYWDILEVNDFGARGYTAEFILAELAKVSEGTAAALAKFNDDELEKPFAFDGRASRVEASLRWILHHVLEHEAHHKGQIAVLKKLIRNG